MKKIIILTALILHSAFYILHSANAANPFFGEDHENKIFVGLSRGLSTGWLFPNPDDQTVPMGQFQIGYSVPNTFFHLPGRQSINGMVMLGWGTSVDHRYMDETGDPMVWNWKEVAETAQIAYFQQDVSLFWGEDWYFGTGVGIGMQRHENDRINTKLVFSFRLFAGYAITENWRVETYFQHFSNGSTGTNFSYNSIGFGLGYSF